MTIDLVNVYAGTNSSYRFSTGNTLPLACAPFGHTAWTLENAEGSWFFDPRDRRVTALRATHQPSPWMGDWGSLSLIFSSDEREPGAATHSATPSELDVRWHRTGIHAVLRASERGAEIAVGSEYGLPVVLRLQSVTGKMEFSEVGGAVVVALKENYPVWYALSGLRREEEVFRMEPGVLRVGVSTIGAAEAVAALDDPGRAAAEAWEEIFSRYEIDGEERDVRVFANCLNRVHLFPRVLTENGRHRSPYSGRVVEGPGVTDNGFWDTYRTFYPWLFSTMPETAAMILEGWASAAREGGWFPQWASPGYRACMVGTHVDAVFGDAAARGVRLPDGAFDLLARHAREEGDEVGAWGRRGVEAYNRQGWIAESETDHSVARALDYAYDDHCLALLAERLGRDPSEFAVRAANWRHHFDPAVGHFRAREADGSWREPWDEWAWGGPYVEGGPWQTAFAVPHDPDGLAEIHGGREKAVEKLLSSFSMAARFEIGAYGGEIHEMTEMAVAGFGQYAHSNQPVHHHIALLARWGEKEKAGLLARRVMRELYSPEDFPGDEDNGEMAAWYLWAAIGRYPLCPGEARLEEWEPLVRATIRREDGTLWTW